MGVAQKPQNITLHQVLGWFNLRLVVEIFVLRFKAIAGALWKDHFRATRIAWSRGLIWATGLTVRYAIGRNMQHQLAVPNNQRHMGVSMECHWPQQDENRFLLDRFMRYHEILHESIDTSHPLQSPNQTSFLKKQSKTAATVPSESIRSYHSYSIIFNPCDLKGGQPDGANVACNPTLSSKRNAPPGLEARELSLHRSGQSESDQILTAWTSLIWPFARLLCQVLVNHRLKMFKIKMTRVWLRGVDGEDLKLIDFGFAVQEMGDVEWWNEHKIDSVRTCCMQLCNRICRKWALMDQLSV